MSRQLQRIYAVFAPTPLGPGQEDMYINLDAVRGNGGVVQAMAQKIRLADQPSCQVLAGHRGSGKSTELGRLRRELETPTEDGSKYFVVQVRADEELDRNDVDFPDVLIALVRQLATQLRERLGIDLKPGYFKDRWQRLKELALSDIGFDKLNLEMGMMKLAAIIKDSPEARLRVRQALEPDTNNWLSAANEVIGTAVLELTKQRYTGLVVILDDLDKMITRPHAAGCSSTEYLFIHRSAQLTAFKCHLVYTLPIELAYSHHESTIRRLYSGLPVVPMTKIATPPPHSRAYSPGLQKFRELIEARLRRVDAGSQELFSSERVRDDLIKLSGGQPTELMTLIREAIITGGLPIGPEGVRRGRQELQRSYRRQLRLDHWPLLEEIRRQGQLQRTRDNEAVFRELLDSRAILLYRNHEEWYGLNPAIEDLQPPPGSVAEPTP